MFDCPPAPAQTLYGYLESVAFAPHSAWGMQRDSIVEVQNVMYV